MSPKNAEKEKNTASDSEVVSQEIKDLAASDKTLKEIFEEQAKAAEHGKQESAAAESVPSETEEDRQAKLAEQYQILDKKMPKAKQDKEE